MYVQKEEKIKVAPGKFITVKVFKESRENSDHEDKNLSNGGNKQEATENPSDEE